MKVFKYFLFFVLCFVLARHSFSEGGFFVFPSFAVNYPNPTGFVNDFAKLYTTQFKNQLEIELIALEKQTGNEITVVTVKSLEGMDIETYAVELFQKWKIGKKGADNGLLLLISLEDRKVRFEVGYGLEQYLTDARTSDIIRNIISPEFKNNNYEAGTATAIERVKSYLAGTDIPVSTANRNTSIFNGDTISIIIFFGYLLLTYLASYLGRTKAIWPGGVLGAVLGGIGGMFLGTIIFAFAGALIIGLIGLLLDFLLTKNYQNRVKKGLPTGFLSTWGGFGGRSSGGGGFGGFGRGSSGGGGSSGGW